MEFIKFPKIPRLKRGMFITEKLDGTNAQILIYNHAEMEELILSAETANYADNYGIPCGDIQTMFVGSRNRFLKAGMDNFGFFAWAKANAEELVKLGCGRHYGEWWGQGVQRTYDLKEKRFSLFNVGRWGRPEATLPDCVSVVPELYKGEMDLEIVNLCIHQLKGQGSIAAPGYMNPEGVVVFHTALNGYFKVLCEKDDIPKGKM